MKVLRPLILPVIALSAIGILELADATLRVRLGIDLIGAHARNALQMMTYLALAWLLSALADLVLTRLRPGNRPVPKLLRDLISALLYLVAILSGTFLLLGHSTSGALAGSGVALALLGFAIRNVVADTLSGIALGLEAPFRIGDWVNIEGMARGRVIEIGWRTTRLLTRDSTYVILPNSQISRQRIVNYSAPRPEFRTQVEIALDHVTPAAEGAEILRSALLSAPLIKQTPPPDVRIQAIEPDGIHYALRYWIGQFDEEIDCRDAIWREVDAALRRSGASTPPRMIATAEPAGAAVRAPSDVAPDAASPGRSVVAATSRS